MHSILFAGAAPPQDVKSRFTPYHIQSWWLHFRELIQVEMRADERRKKNRKGNIRKKI